LVHASWFFSNTEVLFEIGVFFRDVVDVGAVVVGVHDGRFVYLREVVEIIDGLVELVDYVLHGSRIGELEVVVILSFAKCFGANVIDVVNVVLVKVEILRGTLLFVEVILIVMRDYGYTVVEKSNELFLYMGIAVFGVVLLILFFLGWWELLVVFFVIFSILALILFVIYLYGYILNRIMLFALIFSIGILVDDAIVVVENIV
jgi:Cation/multidrug efflux pump